MICLCWHNVRLLSNLIGYQTYPDPFRWYPPRHLRGLAFYYQWINTTLLRHLFRIVSTQVIFEEGAQFSADTLAQPHQPTLLLSNHIQFADPQIILDQAFRAKTPLYWMAGVEPFEKLRGFQTFHLSNNGTFSIDRGVLDRNALLMAQRVLDEGKHPLVIFSEGEADYTQDVTSPYFDGAARFALKTLKQPDVDVTVVPVHLSYHFKQSEMASLSLVWKALVPLIVAFDLPMPLTPDWSDPSEMLADMSTMHQRVLQAVMCCIAEDNHLTQTMTSIMDSNPCITQSGVDEYGDQLIVGLCQPLCDEHGVPMDEQVPSDYTAVMNLKNRLRSQVVRRLRAMSAQRFDLMQEQLKRWEGRYLTTGHLGGLEKMTLTQAERTLLGQGYSDKALDKRLKALKRHLNQMAPYVQKKASASSIDLERWAHQLTMCRSIKLLKILQRDLYTTWQTVEQVDEWRFKLTLLLTGQSVHVGPKVCRMVVGKARSLREAELAHPASMTPEVLTDEFKGWVTGLRLFKTW